MNEWVFLERIAIALVLGTIVGWERESRNGQAGIRTNALVAVAAATYVSVSVLESKVPDHSRIVAQVVSGMGFLGAGLIIRGGDHVRGLNTAATLWGSAAVGCLCGLGFWTYAAIAAGALLVTHFLTRWLSGRV